MFNAVVMDLDGTLVDSIPDVTLCLNAALAAQGLPALHADDVKGMVGGGAHPLVERALVKVGGPADRCKLVAQDFIRGYSGAPARESRVYPGVIAALDNLCAYGCKLGICTNKPEATTFPVLQAFDLAKYFSIVACGDSLEFHKPDRRHLLHALDALNVEPAESVYLGDSETDVAVARNAAVPIILFSHGYTKAPAHSLGADIVIDHFDDLLPALEALRSIKSTTEQSL